MLLIQKEQGMIAKFAMYTVLMNICLGVGMLAAQQNNTNVPQVERPDSLLHLHKSNVQEIASDSLDKSGDEQEIILLINELRDTCKSFQDQKKKMEEAISGVNQSIANLQRLRGDTSAFKGLVDLLKSSYAAQEIKFNTFYSSRVETLINFRHLSVGPLINELKNRDFRNSEIRKATAHVLGKIADAQAIGPLIETLVEDYDEEVLSEANSALNNIDPQWPKSAAAKKFIPSIILSQGTKLSHKAISMLDKIDPQWTQSLEAQRAIPSLIAAIGTRDEDDAVFALEKIYPQWINSAAAKNAVSDLITKSIDSNRGDNAKKALNLIDPNWPQSTAAKIAIPELISALKTENGENGRLILKMIDPNWPQSAEAKNAVSSLLPRLTGNQKASENTIIALGIIADTLAVEPLIAFVLNKKVYNDRGKGMAVTALGEIGDTRAVVPICQFLSGAYGDELVAAIQALDKIGDIRAVDPIIKYALKKKPVFAVKTLDKLDSNWVKRETAKTSLPDLITALHESYDLDSDNRKELAIVLARIGGTTATNALIQYLGSYYDNRREPSMAALKIIGSDAVMPLIAVLNEKFDQNNFYYVERFQDVVSLLGEIGDERAIEPLIFLLKYKDTKLPNVAMIALEKITAETFGYDAKAWENWWKEQKKQK
jgi:HEAT repeat protein